MKRELVIKQKQFKDVEARCLRAVDECDNFRFKVQEVQKDNTEMKLKIDVQMCTIDGLNSELKHQALELNEFKELHRVFEKKCEVLIQ